MADEKAIVSLKDGTKIEVTDLSELSKYSDRKDLDSIAFFGDDSAAQQKAMAAPPAALINATLTIDTDPKQETKTSVEQPKADPVVQKLPPAGDPSTSITITISAVAGALSSAGMPALANFAKNFLKNKLRKQKQSEEEQEEPTDCKTHQIKANAKFAKLSARIIELENKNNEDDSGHRKLNSESNKEILERLEKLEKTLKVHGKKGKR